MAAAQTSPNGVSRLRLDVPREVDGPAVARAAILGLCSEAGISSRQCQTLVLLVSELVTNAVLHSDGPPERPVGLAAEIAPAAARIEVTDGGSGFAPAPRDERRVEGGYGLFLVERAADRWGTERRVPAGTTVWFEMELEE